MEGGSRIEYKCRMLTGMHQTSSMLSNIQQKIVVKTKHSNFEVIKTTPLGNLSIHWKLHYTLCLLIIKRSCKSLFVFYNCLVLCVCVFNEGLI